MHNALFNLKAQVEAGATVINCSWAPRLVGPDITEDNLAVMPSIHEAFTRFFGQQRGNVMTVAALDYSGLRSSFSNFMDSDSALEISIASPGRATASPRKRCMTPPHTGFLYGSTARLI